MESSSTITVTVAPEMTSTSCDVPPDCASATRSRPMWLAASAFTLASGMPMAKLLFGGSAAMGVLILPIMIYHQLQMFVCTVLARRYGSRP